jgi:hypothetical protein
MVGENLNDVNVPGQTLFLNDDLNFSQGLLPHKRNFEAHKKKPFGACLATP